MAKASLTIAISGDYNGKALERAENSLKRMQVNAAAAMGGVAGDLAKAGSAAAEMGGRMHNAGQKLEEVGQAATAGITVPLAAAGAASFTLASDFESSMSRVAGALNDPNANMQELRDLALQMGADTVFSASEAGAAMEELAKGGLTEADIKGGALQTTMDLAAAGSLALADSANVVVQAMGAFGLTADEAVQAANALAGAASASSADVSDLTQGLSQASAQANSAGWSIQDTTAVLGAFADAGVKGSDAGTSLKTMLQRLSAPTDEAAAVMEDLGINVRDSNGMLLDAASLAEELQSKMGGLSQAEKDAATQTLFGSDASRAALIMMNQGREGIEKYTEATNDQEAAQRLANSQMGESERAIEEMKGAVETAAIEVGTALAPAVVEVAGVVGDAAEEFSELDDGTQNLIVGAAGLAAAFGPAAIGVGKLTQGVGNLVVAYGQHKQEAAIAAMMEQQMADASSAAAGSTKKQTDAMGQATASTKKNSEAVKAMAGNTTAAATGASRLGTALGGIAKATGVGIILTGVGTMLADIVGQFADAADHAKLLKSATDDLASSTTAAADAYYAASGEVASSSGNYDVTTDSVRELLQAQADLAQQANDTWTEFGTNAALLDGYTTTIQELSGQAELSAEDQARLADAVNNFNEITGASVSVIDPTTGALSEQADAILAVKDAYLEQAQAAAASDLLQDSLKQQMQTSRDLEQAQADLAQMDEGIMVKWGDLVVASDEAGRAYEEQKQKVEDLEAANDSISDSVDYYNRLVGESADAMNSTQSAIHSYIGSSEAISSALSRTGVSADSFSLALSQVGVSTTQLSTLTSEQLTALVTSYDGSLSSITTKLGEFGIDCTTKGVQGGKNFATGLSSQAQAALAAASLVTGYTEDELASMAAEAGYSGSEGIIEYANGMKREAIKAKFAAQEAVGQADSGLSGGNSYGLGQDYGEGYAAGIRSMAQAARDGAALLASAASSGLAAAQDSNSPSKVAMSLGNDYGEGYGIGIAGTSKYVASQSAGLVSAATAAMPATAAGNYRAAYSSAAPVAAQGYGYGMADVVNRLDRIAEDLESLSASLTAKVEAALPDGIKVNDVELLRLFKRVGAL